ncbi:hypothetical protein J26TS2_23280 [Shouchella clausii]|uniref:DUF6612 family protein n=1 Tax=Shouchella tritolerans TaxID=2979466 RepID=UPI0007884783|nr:DUF6612 family protein [Shouchella tritolerans]GIN12461.1 hypothetical protein J26TS2_23280 [Shouchella clausii]
MKKGLIGDALLAYSGYWIDWPHLQSGKCGRFLVPGLVWMVPNDGGGVFVNKMKWFLLVPFSTLALAACGSDNTSGNGGQEAEAETEPAAETEELTAEDVLVKTSEAMEALDSFRMEMSMDYGMEYEGQAFEMSIGMTADMIQEPLSAYLSTTISDSETGMDFTTDQYMVDDIFYMQNPLGPEWMKYDMSEDPAFATEMEIDTQEQLDVLKSVAEHIALEEEEGAYVLKVDGSDEEMNALVESFMEMGQDDVLPTEEDMALEGFGLKNVTYTIYVNKETYLQEKMVMDFEMAFDDESESDSFSMSGTAEATYSKFNEFDEIDIPQEVVDNAVDGAEMEAEWEAELEALEDIEGIEGLEDVEGFEEILEDIEDVDGE